ncbi:FMN-binding protein [Demequina sp.]|uniref:FMN-binding protein n=1 Tax=Demequina sp. TaxID=2050685 RepID=UPI0025C513E1|nr:FMN-binding protein [Demequina sp.]
MKRNRAALVTSVSTAMLGAGWVAGVVGTAVAKQDDAVTTTIGAVGAPSPSAGTSTGTSASPSPSFGTDPSAGASASAPAPAPAPAGPSGTFDSATVHTRYGNYQVALTIEAGKITTISMLQSGASDGTSRQIAGSALPTLQQRVLSAQTYNVQGVSGASYTSQGFVAAVQNAMQAAGI